MKHNVNLSALYGQFANCANGERTFARFDFAGIRTLAQFDLCRRVERRGRCALSGFVRNIFELVRDGFARVHFGNKISARNSRLLFGNRGGRNNAWSGDVLPLERQTVDGKEFGSLIFNSEESVNFRTVKKCDFVANRKIAVNTRVSPQGSALLPSF